jgi:hypothetical protein
MEAMRVVYVEVEDEYVPVVMDGMKSLKKGREVDVTVIYPSLFQVYRAS